MKTRVGIFEDDRADQFIFQQLITKTSPAIEPIFFRSIEEGIEAARKELFDVVVINIHYYGDNIGLDILQRLRRESKVPFVAIAITPLLLDGDLERILAAGFALALEKPQAFEALGKGKISIPGLC
jgi:CheY-like chemotaxis protein